MIDDGTLPPGSSKSHSRRKHLVLFIISVLGCLLILVSFVFLNWDNSYLPGAFLNGPGVFHVRNGYYGYSVLADAWIWITPVAAVAAFVLACAGWLWDARLLPLISIPAGMGLFMLTRFALTGEQWYYTSIGYWLSVLGLLIVLICGLSARWSSSFVRDVYPAALACCALVGGCLVFLCFFLPWLVPKTPFLSYSSYHHILPPYSVVLTTGMSLASGSFPFLPPSYPRIAPEGFWSLWLVPLVGLLGAGNAGASLCGRRVLRRFWILIPLAPLLLFAFLLRPIVQESITTYGWHLTLLGLALMFICGLLWKERKIQENEPSQALQRKMQTRRRLLAGFSSLVVVAYGGYILWRTSKMYSATQTLPAVIDNNFSDAAVSWAADGKRLAIARNPTFQIWDISAMKLIREIEYPSFVHGIEITYLVSLAWSPDQRFIAVAVGGFALVFEIASGKWISHWDVGGFWLDVSWSADSQRVATTAFTDEQENNSVAIHEASTGKLLRSFTSPPTMTDDAGKPVSPLYYKAVSWSPDGRLLAVGGAQFGYPHPNVITIWDVSSGARVFSTSYIPGGDRDLIDELYMTVAWSPDGKRLAVMSDNTGVKVWDVPGQKLLLTYVGSGATFYRLAWSPDGGHIAASQANVVRIFDTTTGQTLFSYWGHLNRVTWLSWSPRGNYIASSSDDSIRVWQPEIG